TACDTSVLAARNRPMPKHTSVNPTIPARPTPASSSAPRCATNAVDVSVIIENDTMEMVIGQASRSSSRPGRAVQSRDEGGESDLEGKDMTTSGRARGTAANTNTHTPEPSVDRK